MVSLGLGYVSQRRIMLHVLFWCIYVVLSGVLSGLDSSDYIGGIKSELMMLPIKVSLVYFIMGIVVPLFIKDTSRKWSILVAIAALITAIFAYRLMQVYVVIPILYPELPLLKFLNPRGIFFLTFDLFTTVAAALTVKLTRLYFRSRRRQEQLEREKLTSELNYLRTQTNPHYLFNTLNTLYGLALRRDEHTPEAIMRLAQIMDFTLHESRKTSVPLEDEVRIVRNIIDLEKLRSSKHTEIVFEEAIDNPRAQIAPMLLVPFVENAFKHGVATAPEQPFVHVRIEEEDGILLFSVRNNFKNPEWAQASRRESLGLGNVQRQLELLYAYAYGLSIEKGDGVHEIKLKLELEKMMPR